LISSLPKSKLLVSKFINRSDELKLLEKRFNSGKAEFVVIYERRRVGKTALILKFLENKRGVYFLARETSNAENLRRFSQKVAEQFKDEFLLKNQFRAGTLSSST